MTKISFEKYKELTLSQKSAWESSRYFAFLGSCTMPELSESQIPFFYAVQEFPRMLLNLAASIPTTEQRVLLMKNIVEEHGNFDEEKFHTNTFMEHLKALGLETRPVYKSPFVSAWIDWYYKQNYSAHQKASYLAGIEYIYAVVCETVVNVLDKHGISSPHYKKHSVLDWEHAEELLEVSLVCASCVDDNAFKQAQSMFLDMLDALVVPTKAKITEIAKEPVSFFYSREDSSVEIEVLNSLKCSSPKVLMTCSGGEHIFRMQTNSKKAIDFTVFDLNPNQIKVFESKLSFTPQFSTGKFEALFQELRNYFKGIYALDKSSMPWDLIDYAVDLWFDNKVLNGVFGDDATKHSSSCFKTHFKQAFKTSFEAQHFNALNVLFGDPVLSSIPKNLTYSTKVAKLSDLGTNEQFDLIDISNIGDWLALTEYRVVLRKMLNSLTPGGALICRKLLGDYDLYQELEQLSRTIRPVDLKEFQDKTHFYSQGVIAYAL